MLSENGHGHQAPASMIGEPYDARQAAEEQQKSQADQYSDGPHCDMQYSKDLNVSCHIPSLGLYAIDQEPVHLSKVIFESAPNFRYSGGTESPAAYAADRSGIGVDRRHRFLPETSNLHPLSAG